MVTVKVARTQHERRTLTRGALLTAAAQAVTETGPSTSVADIARRADVSTGALQYHFESKADLMVAVVEAGWNDLVERSIAATGQMPLRDRVAAMVSAVWESYRQPACLAAFMISSDPNIDPDVATRGAAAFEQARRQLDQAWLDAFADLGLPAERITTARRFARSHLNGMVIQRQMGSVEPDPEEELKLLCDATVRILAAPAEMEGVSDDD